MSLRRKDRMPDRENERPARTKAAIHFFTKIVERLQVSTKKPKAKDVRIDSAKKINTKSKMENAEETSKKKTNVKPKVEKIEQPQKEDRKSVV